MGMSDFEPNQDQPGLRIRLSQSSQLIWALNVAGGIFTVFFLTMLTRTISLEDYASWVIIIRYVGYFSIPAVVYSYWLPRNISRGFNTARTALYAALALGAASVPVYLTLTSLVSRSLDEPWVPAAIASAILFLEYLNAFLTSLSYGHSPQISGYGQFAFKAFQAIAGFALVASLLMGLIGAVLAVLIGRIALVAVMGYLNRGKMRDSRYQPEVLRSWLACSWVPLLGSLTCLVYWLDILVVAFIFNDTVPIAYYGAAMAILALPLFATSIANVLYPKVLAGKGEGEIREAVWLTLLFSVPFTLFIIIYAEPIVALLGPAFLPAAWPLRTFGVSTVFQLVGGVAVVTYMGMEKSDITTATPDVVMRSVFFKNNLIGLAANIFYVAALLVLSSAALGPVGFTTAWGLVMVASNFMTLALLVIYLRLDFRLAFPVMAVIKDLGRLILPSLPLIVVAYLWPTLPVESVGRMLGILALNAVIFGAVYVPLLALVSKKYRESLIFSMYALRDILKRHPR
jgi:O-antigen/teichoic acid export membrane protein